MKRILGTAAVLAALAGGASAAVATPRLALVTTSPLVVAGSQFRANERVTITTLQVTRIVRTTATGTFRTSFGGTVVFDRCSAVQVVAIGARGDRAVLARPRPLCAPAGSP